MSTMQTDTAASAHASQAAIFAALGDGTRLALLERLSRASPQSISHLAEGATVTRQAITKHLRVLESAGIVRSIRRGRETLFEFRPKALDDAGHYLARLADQWDDALMRLKRFVED
jgi:DNA-binding transcriptional ArsR family regulator